MTSSPPAFGKPLAWFLAACVILGLPATSWIYWPAVGESGVLEPDADTVIIPMMQSVFLAIALLPVVCGTTWLCLRGRHLASLTAWNRSRPVQSALVSLCFAVPFSVALWCLIVEINAPAGWHGLSWLPYTLVTLAWFSAMRGFALTQPDGG